MKILIAPIIFLFVACGSGGEGDNNKSNDTIPESSRQEYCTGGYQEDFFSNGYFADVENTGNDELMCWAAAAANLLTQAGYADDEQELFELFKDNWDNKKGYWIDAVNWYLKSINVNPDSVTVKEYREDAAVDFAVCALHRGEAVIIRLLGSNGGHDVTVYEYSYDVATDTITLYYAESSDGKRQLRPLVLTYNHNKGRWQNDTYKLTYSASLKGLNGTN